MAARLAVQLLCNSCVRLRMYNDPQYLPMSVIVVGVEPRVKDGEAITFSDSAGNPHDQSSQSTVAVSGARTTPAAGGKFSEREFIWPGSNTGTRNFHVRMRTPASPTVVLGATIATSHLTFDTCMHTCAPPWSVISVIKLPRYNYIHTYVSIAPRHRFWPICIAV